MTDEQIIARCKSAGIKWIPPQEDEDESGAFPGSFDMVSMGEMRALLAAGSSEGQEPVYQVRKKGRRKWEDVSAISWAARQEDDEFEYECRIVTIYRDSDDAHSLDAARYRWIATLQDWGDVERMCWSSTAKSATQFKADLDAYIDAAIAKESEK